MDAHRDRIVRWTRRALVLAGAGGLLALASTLLTAGPASAVTSCSAGTVTISWDGGAGTSNWGDANNWSTNALPASADNVCINLGGAHVQLGGLSATVNSIQVNGTASLTLSAGGTLTLSSTSIVSQVKTLTVLAGGTLGGAGSVNVAGSLTWSGGAMTDAGTTTIASGATLSVDTAGSPDLDGSRVLSIAANATATFSGDGSVQNFHTSSITNAGTMTLTGNASFGPSIVNTGTITKTTTSTGQTTIPPQFTNNGTVNVQAGQLELLGGDGGSTAGTFHVSPSGELDFQSGFYSLTSAAKILGDGTGIGAVKVTGGTLSLNGTTYGSLTFVVISGTLTLNSDYTVQTVALGTSSASGTIGGTGTLTVTSSFAWMQGSMVDFGTTTIASGASLSVDTAKFPDLDGSRVLSIASGGTATFTGDGGVQNFHTSSIANAGTMTVTGNSSFGPAVANTGTITKSSTGQTLFGQTFANNGTVNDQAGQLVVTGGDGGSTAGTFNVSPSAELDFQSGFYSLTSAAKIVGDGTGIGAVKVTGGTISLNGSTYGSQAFVVVSGTLTLNSDYSVQTVALGTSGSSGNIAGTGTLTVTGTFTWTRGSMFDSGTTTIASGASLSVDTNPFPDLDGSRVLSIASGGTATFTGDGSVQNFHTSSIANAGTMTVTGNSSFGPAIINTGTLSKTSSGHSVFASVNNAGSLNLNGGTLFVGNGVTNSGTVTLVSTTSLEASSYSQTSAGTLSTHIAGTTPGAGFGRLTVDGTASLDGTLALTTDSGFSPGATDTFAVVGGNPVNGQFATVTGTAIANNQHYTVAYSTSAVTVGVAHASLAVNDVSVQEGASGTTTNAVFTVSLDQTANAAVGVHVATADGTATAGTDYTAVSKTISISAGQSGKQVAVPVLGDCTHEANETFTLNLSNATGAGISDPSGAGTIQDDDTSPPLLDLSSPLTVPEGDAATTTATFTVTLTHACGPNPVSVDVSTSDGTATSPADYTATSRTVTFNPGETSKPFAVTVVGDDTTEATEGFTATLSNAAGATINQGTQPMDILDDDGAPTFFALTAPSAGGAGQLITMNAQGGNRTAVTSGIGIPVFSPDGTRIAWDGGGIWVANADGSAQTHIRGSGISPTWSPDDTKIAFVDRDPVLHINEIWVMDSDGNNAHPLTSKVSWSPVWSRDGSTIIFMKNTPFATQSISEMAPDGSNERVFTNLGNVQAGSLALSPDGSKFALDEFPNGQAEEQHHVWVLDARSAALVGDSGWVSRTATSPSWDPSSTRVAFAGDGAFLGFNTGFAVDVWVMNFDGTGQVDLTPDDLDISFDQSEPVWRPDPNQACTIFGTPGDDNLVGTSGNDVICGLGGNDTINGGGGKDSLVGGDGNDTLIGATNSAFDGGAGSDTVSFAGATCAVTASLKTGQIASCLGTGTISDGTVENLSGTSFADTLSGNSSPNTLSGLGQADTLNGGLGADTLNGGAGSDTASYADAPAGMTVNLATGTVSGGAGDDHIVTGSIEIVAGSNFADSLTGDANANTLRGNGGDDTLNVADGISGNDGANGGPGTDTCSADTGDVLTSCEVLQRGPAAGAADSSGTTPAGGPSREATLGRD